MVKQAMNSDHSTVTPLQTFGIRKTSFACVKQAAQWLNLQKAEEWQIEHPKDAKYTQT